MATNDQGVISTAQSGELHSNFHARKQEILASLEKPNPSLPDISKQIAALRTEVDGFGARLPKYDRARYENQLTELEAKLAGVRAKEKPKSRFAFSKPKTSAAAAPPAPAPITPAEPEPAPPTPATSIAAPGSTTHSISKLSNILIRPLLSPGTGNYTLSLSSLSHCIIDLRPPRGDSDNPPPTLTTLHGKDWKECVLVAPVLPGSAMLSDLVDCLVVVGAQQFRMHSSTHTSVLLHVASLPVIEHSKDLKFGGYPSQLLPTPPPFTSKHAQVQDFDWVRGGPSPNWATLSDAEAEGLVTSQLVARLDAALPEKEENESLIDDWVSQLGQ
ncbi:hypothetical protein IAT38_008102 [Cryptococcus sp. DSM 104549]